MSQPGDNELLLHGGSSAVTQSQVKRGTYTVNGKEYKKRAKKPRKQNLDPEKCKGDPISTLGFGIVAYLGMMYYMIWAFALFSFLLIPVFKFYSNGQAYA